MNFWSSVCPHGISSKLDYFRLMGERTNGSHTILEVEHLSVSIIYGIHLLQTRIGIQHRFSRLNTVILYQFTGNTNPLATLECTQLFFRISMQLLGNILLTSLDVQLAFKNMCRAKWAHSRLVVFERCHVICFSFFKNFTISSILFFPFPHDCV